MIIEDFTFANKIRFFYKIYNLRETWAKKGNKKLLTRITNDLKQVNTFRNHVVHANWQTLDKDGFVRIKIETDNGDARIKARKEQIKPKTIRTMINNTDRLIDRIDRYHEKALAY
jgi:hypothetical protein